MGIRAVEQGGFDVGLRELLSGGVVCCWVGSGGKNKIGLVDDVALLSDGLVIPFQVVLFRLANSD